MKRIRSLTAVIVVVLAVLGVASGVTAGDHKPREQDAIRDALRRGEVLPLMQVLDIAAKHVPGDVIEVELEHEKKLLIYEIKILSQQGHVRKLKIDARTGTLIKIEDD